MTRVYNRTLTPLPADGNGRLIDGRSEGEADEDYAPVARAIETGSFRVIEEAPSSKKTSSKKTTSKPKTTSDSDSEEN